MAAPDRATDASANPAGLGSLFVFHGALSRGAYLRLGAGLMTLKFALDAALVALLFERPWTPWFYLSPLRWSETYPAETPWQYLLFAAVSLPFVWIGVALTARRLRDAGLSPLYVAWFVVPMVNLVLFALLALLPSAAVVTPGPRQQEDRALQQQPSEQQLVDARGATMQRFVAASLLGLAVTFALFWLVVEVLRDYGEALFLAGPWLHGFAFAVVYRAGRPCTRGAVVKAAMLSACLACGLLLLLGLEGLGCIVMALPMVLPMVALGAFMAHAIVSVGGEWSPGDRGRIAGFVLLAGPAAALVEHRAAPAPATFAVTTEVAIEAPPEQVWPHVVAFPELPPPRELLFRAGIAWPTSARIDGEGPGAQRHCTFNTGSFVEPIEVWDPPRRLAFTVVESPQPMIEWNPLHPRLDAPHLHGFFRARRGEFVLEPLPGGRTLLRGTTWYEHGLRPEAYWRVFSDTIVHAIHRRVLEHVAALSEAGGAAKR